MAEEAGQVVGHILFIAPPIVTTRSGVDALALAPMAVSPDRQRRGIGSALMRDGLRSSSGRGHRIVVVVGHPEFYPRFGCSAKLARRFKSPLFVRFSGRTRADSRYPCPRVGPGAKPGRDDPRLGIPRRAKPPDR
jgi:predicted N-acetyltransferase YhbS